MVQIWHLGCWPDVQRQMIVASPSGRGEMYRYENSQLLSNCALIGLPPHSSVSVIVWYTASEEAFQASDPLAGYYQQGLGHVA